MKLNRILAIVALALGAVAVFGNPYRGSVVSLNTQELAVIVESKVDHVFATDLADWIIQGETDYRLIDIRETDAYAEYHMPTAEHQCAGTIHWSAERAASCSSNRPVNSRAVPTGRSGSISARIRARSSSTKS